MASIMKGCLLLHICLLIGNYVSSMEDRAYRISILWDQKVIPEITHLRPSLDTTAKISTNSSVSVSYVDVTNKTPFQIYNIIYNEIMEGTVSFISACSCYTGVSVNSVAKDLQVPVIALETGCDYGEAKMSNIVYFPHMLLDIGRAAAQVTSHVGWLNVVLIYDEQTAKKVDNVMEKLSESSATVQAFRVNDTQSTSDIQSILDFVREHYPHPAQFLVVCSLECTQEVLLQANLYGKMNDVQALYTFETQWLLLVEASWLNDLEMNGVADIDNVAAIVPGRATDKSSESLVEEAFSYLLQSIKGVEFSNTTSHTRPLKSCNESKKFFEDLTVELQVYTAMRKGFQGAVRDFQVVSQWTPSRSVSGEIFPNKFFGLNARHFLVATLAWPPFVSKNDSAENTTDEYYGLCMEMLQELSRTLNFSYSITEPADNEWGAIRNGSWTGLPKMMMDKKADMVVAPMAATVERSQVMDFTEPFYQEYTTVLVKLPDPEAQKWSLYLSPFKWDVWMCIVLSIPFMGIVIWLITKFSPYYSPSEIGRGLAKLDNAMLYALGSIFSQGGVHLPTAQSGRFVIGFWWMYCIVVVATYSGNLIAFLTVSIPSLPFNNLEEMTETSGYKFGVQGATAFQTALENSQSGVLVDVHRKMVEFWSDDPSINSTDEKVHERKVFNEKYAWIGDKTAFEVLMSKYCDIDLIREEIFPMQYAVGLHNNSAYNNYISEGIKKTIEGGLINKWKKKHWPRQNFCSRGLVTEAKPVTLKDVQGAYYALGFLVFVAACILMVEHVLRARKALSQDTNTDLAKGYANGGYMANGYIANGHIANGDAKGVSNGVANGYSNGIVSNGMFDKYGRDLSQYETIDVSSSKKKKKRKGSEKNSMEAGAPVFSRSLWS